MARNQFPNDPETLQSFKKYTDYSDVIVADQPMHGMQAELLAHQVMRKCPEFSVTLWGGFRSTMKKEKVFAMGLQVYLSKPL